MRHKMHPYYSAHSPHEARRHEEERDRQDALEDAPLNAPAQAQGEDLAGHADAVQDMVEPTEKESAPEAAPADDEALARCKAEMEELRLRNAAEMENFKKRLTREHQEQMRFAAERVLGDLLPSLDNLDLALQYGSQHEACKDMLQGISMTRKLLLDALEKNGLKALGEVGDEFNPEVHEAIGFEPNQELAPGSVTRVMQRGYKLNDRLLRAAKVMINQ